MSIKQDIITSSKLKNKKLLIKTLQLKNEFIKKCIKDSNSELLQDLAIFRLVEWGIVAHISKNAHILTVLKYKY